MPVETQMIQQAYKFALDPSSAQAAMLASHAGARRYAWEIMPLLGHKSRESQEHFFQAFAHPLDELDTRRRATSTQNEDNYLKQASRGYGWWALRVIGQVVGREVSPPPGIDRFDAPMAAATGDGRRGRVPAGCVFWVHGAERAFATVPEDHGNCSVGSVTHGLFSPARSSAVATWPDDKCSTLTRRSARSVQFWGTNRTYRS